MNFEKGEFFDTFFTWSNITKLADVYGCIRLNCRESRHSFTGHVLEVYFDEGHQAAHYSRGVEELTGQFVALRVVSPEVCYVSTPIWADSIPF